jgi:hypothetical protein
MPTLE